MVPPEVSEAAAPEADLSALFFGVHLPMVTLPVMVPLTLAHETLEPAAPATAGTPTNATEAGIDNAAVATATLIKRCIQ